MTTQPPKGPPRFVPTLTDVVRVDALPLPASAIPSAPPVTAASAVPASVAGVTSNTQAAISAAPVVVAAAPANAPSAAPASTVRAASAPASTLPAGIEEYIVHRVMQRVDVVLDQRLREAIATVVQEQTRSMVPRLREEVESVVRHAVYEAVADELSADGNTAA